MSHATKAIHKRARNGERTGSNINCSEQDVMSAICDKGAMHKHAQNGDEERRRRNCGILGLSICGAINVARECALLAGSPPVAARSADHAIISYISITKREHQNHKVEPGT